MHQHCRLARRPWSGDIESVVAVAVGRNDKGIAQSSRSLKRVYPRLGLWIVGKQHLVFLGVVAPWIVGGQQGIRHHVGTGTKTCNTH